MPVALPGAAYRVSRMPTLRCMSSMISSSSPRQQTALVYSGPGAGARSVLSALQSLKHALHPDVLVDTVDTDSLLSGRWQQQCTLLVMPGGADLPFCRHLNGRGNALIRAFVEGGGSYLGLCAGAYYGCSRVEFEAGSPLEVVGDRELCFFPGTARGSVFPGFDYQSEAGAVAARIQFRRGLSGGGAPLQGGSQQLTQCVDYVNGGPEFVLTDGSHLAWPSHAPSAVTLLARYADKDHAAAAVLCRVGAGRAVLCGTHPELHPSWLDVSMGGDAVDGAHSQQAEDETTSADVAAIKAQLEAGAGERWGLWQTLLAAAGLEHLLPVKDGTGALEAACQHP